MVLLEIKDLVKVYNEEYMLDKLNFTVEEGNFFAVIGPENCGKTPLLEIIVGLKFQQEGRVIFFEDEDANENRINFVPDDIASYEDISAAQLFERTLKRHKLENIKECQALCDLFEIDVDEPLTKMTFDKNKCVTLINAIISKPNLLILDEPYDFLSEDNYQKLLNVLKRRCERGMTVIISCEKYLDVKGYCNQYIYLKDGDLVKKGVIDENFRPWRLVTVEECDFDAFKAIGAMPVNLVGNKKYFVYKGDMKLLASAIAASGCNYFLVEELTLEEQLFLNFERWN